MKKLISFIVMIGLFVLIAWALLWCVGKIFDTIDEEKTFKSEVVGEKVAIDGDTLSIVDYKLLTEKYVLSNGVEISEAYVNKVLIDE